MFWDTEEQVIHLVELESGKVRDIPLPEGAGENLNPEFYGENGIILIDEDFFLIYPAELYGR